MEASHTSWPFGELLVEKGLISEEELDQALLQQKNTAGSANPGDELALLAEVAAQDLTIARLLERLDAQLVRLPDSRVSESRQSDVDRDSGFLVFAPSGGRYVIAQRDGPVPNRGSRILFGEPTPVAYVVTRLGPSPLPLGRRRCAYLHPLH